MSKKNDDFFKRKKVWSEVKDELLGCYLRPYIQKLISTNKPIVYIDCFAGKGLFEDGKDGSPIIALKVIDECISNTHEKNAIINTYFIELNHAEELKMNLGKNNYSDANVISGKYEEEIRGIISKYKGCNLFLYIDPYGIKALDYNLFKYFTSSNEYYSVELLINFNSFGFIREACRVLGMNFGDETIFEDLVEYDETKLDKNEESIKILNEIAGGDYWQDILHKKNDGLIDTKEAEKLFSDMYCKALRKHYKYVLNMPVRIKKGQHPKYRMVHATNHVMGCLIMADNICNRWQLMKDIQTFGQMSLFNEDINNNIIDDDELHNKVETHLKKYTYFERLNNIMADFYMIYGPICPTKDIKNVYKQLEKQGYIMVIREPKLTETKKQPSKFYADDNGKMTKLRWIL